MTRTPSEIYQRKPGRDIESVVLTRAVKWHAEHHLLLNDGKTVVFR